MFAIVPVNNNLLLLPLKVNPDAGDNPVVVETIPGWAHNISNIGLTDMIVMIWANENFDKSNSDTIAHEV